MNIEPTTKEAEFIAAYIEAIVWTDTGEIDQPSVTAELDETFERESVIDCLAFFSRISCYLGDDNIAQAGHDFWLTRNGHGTGFWDRPEIYQVQYAGFFTNISRNFGEANAIFDEDE
jgi:hypothetical protein